MPKPEPALLVSVEAYLTVSLRLNTRRRRLAFACAASFILTYLAAWFVSQVVGFPTPFVQDEFCYLLTGETFASGHLAMPSHPMAYFFETFHQIQWPAYASKYPPGQGLVLAVGYLLGDPIYGVWLCSAALSAAFVWMLGGFCRARWAFLGGLAAGLWFGSCCYWAQSYWGGTLPALGSALVWGATRRFVTRPRGGQAFILGGGAALLLLSRPFEGMLACLVPAGLILGRFIAYWKNSDAPRHLARLSVALIPLAGAVLFFCACNRAATGSPVRLAYWEYREQYDRNPIFVWEKPRVPPEFHHSRMEEFDVLIQEQSARFPAPFGKDMLARLNLFDDFYTGGTLAFLVVALIAMPGRWAKRAAAGAAVSLLSVALVYVLYRHYLAAAAAPVLIWATATLRWLWLRFPGKRQWLAIGLPLLFSFLLISRGAGGTPVKTVMEFKGYRDGLVKQLEGEQGQHLVLVRYERGVEPHIEYVYNGAHIDSQKIVWARWTEDAGKRGLYDYYRGRRFWMLTVPKQGEPRLREFNWVPNSSSATK